MRFYCINSCLVDYVVTCTGAVTTVANMQFLTILLAVNLFLGGVGSVTDKEFKVYSVQSYIVAIWFATTHLFVNIYFRCLRN